MTSKPSNWYDMTWDQQRDWQRREREREDLEYDRDRERKSRESAERDASDERRARRREAAAHQEELDIMASQLQDANTELALAHQWLRERGLWEEFDDWASYRRDA